MDARNKCAPGGEMGGNANRSLKRETRKWFFFSCEKFEFQVVVGRLDHHAIDSKVNSRGRGGQGLAELVAGFYLPTGCQQKTREEY